MRKFILGDCMNKGNGLPSYPNNFFDLAIVDPPYGLDIANSPRIVTDKGIKGKSWDKDIPNKQYFNELFRVSKNQIIWGWNYFVPYLNSCQCYIVWNKKTNGSFADCESAYTSFKRPAIVFEFVWNGMLQGDMKNKETRIHPTQKPVKLYQKTLETFAKKGDLILDTHVGSASSLVAFESMGFNYVGYEKDKDYYQAAKKRMSKGIPLAMTF